ncbi:MAG: hypothetical protein NXI31_00380 [bacterium]|nr:hypothetical protein [bacterium]
MGPRARGRRHVRPRGDGWRHRRNGRGHHGGAARPARRADPGPPRARRQR